MKEIQDRLWKQWAGETFLVEAHQGKWNPRALEQLAALLERGLGLHSWCCTGCCKAGFIMAWFGKQRLTDPHELLAADLILDEIASWGAMYRRLDSATTEE